MSCHFGLLLRRMIPLLTLLLFGAVTQAALQLATAGNPSVAREQARAAYKRSAYGLLTKPAC